MTRPKPTTDQSRRHRAGRDRIRARPGHSGRSSGIGPVRRRCSDHAQRRIYRGRPLRTWRRQLPHRQRVGAHRRSSPSRVEALVCRLARQAVDLVMLIMNEDGMKNLLTSQFKLGADASVAAGPVGRHAAADTDWKMQAQVLSYSRARGVFAGLELSGAAIRQDKDSHPRILRPHGAVQDVADRHDRCACRSVSFPEYAGQVGEDGSRQIISSIGRERPVRAAAPRSPVGCGRLRRAPSRDARAARLDAAASGTVAPTSLLTTHFPVATVTSFPQCVSDSSTRLCGRSSNF